MVAGEVGIAGDREAIGEAMLQLDAIILRVEIASGFSASIGRPELGLGRAFAEQLGAVGVAEILLVSVRRRWKTVKAEQGERAGAEFHDVGPHFVVLCAPR